MEMNFEQKQLTEQLFLNREYNISHPTYDTELNFYNIICEGNLEQLKEIYSDQSFFDSDRGVLSDHPVNNARYHLIVTITMVSRFCIEKGLNEQKAYGLSDVYIRKADRATTIDEIRGIHKKVVYEYANEMVQIKNKEMIPKNLRRALDYIYDNLNERIKISEITDCVGISESQLRRDFQTYLSVTPAEFINEKKIEFARNKLVYTDISYVDLANDLGFASHSHFIKIFKQYTGMTPAEYRNKKYRKHFVDICRRESFDK